MSSLGFLALPVLVFAILGFESVVGMLSNLSLNDVVDTNTPLLESLYLNARERLHKLAVVDELIRCIGVL